jgi:hypothetical protein
MLSTMLAMLLTGQYGYGAQYTYQPQVVTQTVVAPAAVVALPVSSLGVPYYFSVGDYLREDKIAEIVTQRVTNRLAAGAGAVSPSTRAGNKPVAAAPSPTVTDLDNRVSSIFQTCINCHKPGTAKAGVTLFAADGSLYQDANTGTEMVRRWRILDAVTGGPDVNFMPKNGNPLTDDEVDTVRKWLRAYASKSK